VATTFLSLFKGKFVYEVTFPENGPGLVEMVLYYYNSTTPIVANCTLSNCKKSYGDGGLSLECQESHCCTTGFATQPILRLFQMVYGPTTITIDDTGKGKMQQVSHCMPVPFLFQCAAKTCQFKDDTVPPLSTGAIAGIGVTGGVVALAVLVLILLVVVNNKKKKQMYLNFGGFPPITLSWKNVTCKLPNGKYVLNEVSGTAMPGTVTAIIGESGAGKTSLIDCLTFRKTVGDIQGDILMNNRPKQLDFNRVSGYVMQDELMVESQTVRETIRFAANLRLPQMMNEEERADLTDKVIQLMGLTNVQDTIIGYECVEIVFCILFKKFFQSGPTIKGISGGEKKRVALGVELVSNPSLIFCDEPTSGLDSSNALRIVKTLHLLAHEEGKTVIFSIHQPASQLFELFDEIHVMAKGYLLYSGPAKQMLSYFENVGYGLQKDAHFVNPCDFVIGEVVGLDEAECRRISQYNRDRTVSRPSRKDMMDFFDTYNDDPTRVSINSNLNASSSSAREREEEHLLSPEEVEAVQQSRAIGQFSQSWIMQFWYLSRRMLVSSWRSRIILVQAVTAMACGLILGGIYYNLTDYTSGVQNRVGIIIFVLIFLSVISLSSIDSFIRNRNIYLREKSAGFYSPSAFFASTVFLDILFVRIAPCILLSVNLYWLAGLHPGPSHFFFFTLILVLVSLASTGFMMFIGAIVNSNSVGNLVGTLVLLFSMLFGGLLVNQNSIPVAVFYFKFASFFFFAFESLMINEFQNLVLIASVPGERDYPLNGVFYLNLLGLDVSNFYLDVYLLLAYALVAYIAAFVVLLMRKEKR
jgi:ABC-type multidrug transport system ATPase subunit/ABC-type multidrug transport system permease subunit